MKTEKKKTLRGSALFTVVAVMAILILFLTGTLALATASNSRAHKSYAVSQASYTARAAIRAFKEGMEQDADLAATVGALGEGSLSKLRPKIQMSDTTMGEIGSWDDSDPTIWNKYEIKLDPVKDSVDWVYDADKNEWVSWNIVKIEATCRVGQEEETVIAYISKHGEPGEQKKSNNEVKGLQEAGGNNFINGGNIYGGLGVGLADSTPGSYLANNEFETHTSLTFINGDLDVKTSSLDFSIEDNEKGITPASGMVVMGNLVFKNDKFIDVKYKMKKDFAQKDIPYLYVDHLLSPEESVNSTIYFVKGNGSPFNIFAGTIYTPHQFIATADLYLMDEPSTDGKTYSLGVKYKDDGFPALKVPESLKDDPKYKDSYPNWPDGQWWDNPDTHDDKVLAMADPANYLDTAQVVQVGKNVIGSSDGIQANNAKELHTWTESTFKRLDDNLIDSIGGSIFCNGDLELWNVHVYGDVRVKGKCIIHGGGDRGTTKIDGDLVVENAYDNPSVSGLSWADGAGEGCVTGNIYVSQGTATATESFKDGYSLRKGLLPDYKVYVNKELPNVEIEESAYEISSDGKYIYAGETYDSKPYIQCKPLTDDASGTTIGATNPEVITTSEKTRFKAFSDGYVIDSEGYFEVTTKEKTYYNKDGEECGESEAEGEYYVDAAGNHVTRDEAVITTVTGTGTVGIGSYKANHPEGVYPENMTREKIYGTSDGKNADPSTKIITTLVDARKSLGMDADDGYFDEQIYVREKPSNPMATYDSTWDKSKSIEITRPKEGIGWVILDNVKLDAGCDIIVKDNPDAIGSTSEHIKYRGGIIRFFIVGDVVLNKGSIGPAEILDGTLTDISYKDDFGIEYYTGGEYRTNDDASNPKKVAGTGTEGTLSFPNNSVLVGSVKAPFLELAFDNGINGPKTINYTKEDGTTTTLQPCIIGNALIKHLKKATNGLPLAYTKSGAGGSTADDEETAVDPSGAEWKFKYYTR